MALNAEDLAKRLAALRERFTTLAATLTQTTQQLQASGTLPPETLVDEIAKVRTDFVDVRHRVLDVDEVRDRKSTRLNSSHLGISYAVFCLKKKKKTHTQQMHTHSTT